MRDFVIVLDPGARRAEAALALADAVRSDLLRRPGLRVLLTRERAAIPGIGERIRCARECRADVFLSVDSREDVHAPARHDRTYVFGSPQADVFEASRKSVDLAGHLSRELGIDRAFGAGAANGFVGRPIELIDPRRHDAQTAACLVGFCTSPTPRIGAPDSERGLPLAVRLANAVDEHLARLLRPARGLVQHGAIERAGIERSDWTEASREVFDLWHEVPLVPQLTGMSCWAAAAAMIIGWRDRVHIDPEEVARGAGRWRAYRDGLEPADVSTLARTWGLSVEAAASLSVRELAELLVANGPLWVGEASPGLHSVVVAGMHGDGTVDRTTVHVADPWPEGRGERYGVSFRQFLANFHAARALDGGHAQVLHAGGRRGSSRNVHTERVLDAPETSRRSNGVSTERGER